MLDIKWICENPEKFNEVMKARGASYKAETLIKLYEERNSRETKIQNLQEEKNKIAKEVAMIKRSGGNADGLFERSKKINEEIKSLDSSILQDAAVPNQHFQKHESMILKGSQAIKNAKIVDLRQPQDELQKKLDEIPNILSDEVPIGADESHNVEVEKFGVPRQFSFKPKSHFELGENLKMLDFEQSAKMSGARFSTLSAGLARLERALSNFMLDVAGEFGYTEISPPNLVKSEAMRGSGQLPKFCDEAFSTSDGYWLIPTAEVPLVNLVADKILSEDELPLRFTAYTPCFRREAGSAGKDTRGMIRQHQFKKVELVAITTAEQSEAEHEKIVNIASEVLKRLELPFRKVLLCSGDVGFCSKKTFDLEVWLPSEDKYREISSCSNCGDFQARRMKARYKSKKDGKNYFVHTLNGSALAVGRTLIAILENYQNEDGSVMVPKALIGYFSGSKIDI
jgi:seryl-tRNA synthetase